MRTELPKDIKNYIKTFVRECKVCAISYITNKYECIQPDDSCRWNGKCDKCRSVTQTWSGPACDLHRELDYLFKTRGSTFY